jgi:hypothetical protein
VIETLLVWLEEPLVADQIRIAIRKETPSYASFDDPAEEERWAATIDAGLAMFIRCAREQRGLTDDAREVMQTIGRRRAEQRGMTVDAIDASIRVAVSIALDHVMQRLPADRTSMDALRELSARLTRYGNEIAAAATVAFLVRKEELARRGLRADVRLFDDVFGGTHDVTELIARGAAQGIDLSAAWAAVLLPQTESLCSGDLEASLLGKLPQAIVIPMATAPVAHSVVIFRAADQSEWAAARRVLDAVAGRLRITLVTIGPTVGPERLRCRYTSARALLPYAADLAADRAILDPREMPEVALLTGLGDDAIQTYLDDVFGPLDETPIAKKRRILRTIEAVARHGNAPKAVAQETGFDVLTVRKHIGQVETLTGLCLDRLDHVQRLGLGVLLQKVVRGLPISR